MTAAADRLAFGVLGPLEVTRDAAQVALGGPRQRALLAVLLLSANRVVPREHLVDALWGEEPPPTAANALQVAVHGLRKAVGAHRIERAGTGYRMHVEPGELDLDRFVTAAERARSLAPDASAALLRDALGLWRGRPLVDLLELDALRRESERLEELRLSAIEQRVDAELDAGSHEGLAAELEKLVAEHPFRERLQAQLMLALYRAGRQVDALEAYRRARAMFVDELGMEPAPELQELERAILRQDASLTRPERTKRRTRPLPTPPTRLIGRDFELIAATDLLRGADVRLVTFSGPGGTGKTRLALAVAEALEDELADGAVFVDLSALRGPDLVPQTIAGELGVAETADLPPATALRDALVDRELLLVLDNFEGVTEAAQLVAELLAAAPALSVLVTSRVALRVRGEHEFPVPPLAVPAQSERGDLTTLEQTPAVELFLAHARGARHDFVLTEANADAIADVCIAVDGLPLALELAAVRSNVLSPAELRTRLEHRLDVLTAGAPDLPARQRTLRATIDWSYDLLDDRSRDVFARLAVFSSGWRLESAEAVCGAELDDLAALVDRSLVRRNGGDDRPPRFRMLETIREYALERLTDLPDADEVRRRHAAHFLELAERAEPELLGGNAHEWLDRLEEDHDNLRVALRFAAATDDAELGLRLATALQYFWRVRGHMSEARRRVQTALDHGAAAPLGLRARGLVSLAVFTDRLGAHDEAQQAYEAALELYREAGDTREEARTLAELAGMAIGAGDHDRALALYEQTIPLFRESGDERALAVCISNVASVASITGDYDRARVMGEEALALARARSDHDQTTISLYNLGRVALEQGRLADAGGLFLEALQVARGLGYRELYAYSVVGCGELAAAWGVPERAARLLAAGEALFAELGVEPGPEEQAGMARARDALDAALDPSDRDELEREGRSLGVEEAIREASHVAELASTEPT